MHTVTAKLNKDARLFSGDKGDTFFVSLGEKHYDYKTKESGWTNYEAAIFCKPSQRDYMINNLKAGAVVTVSGKTLIIEDNEQYGIKLQIQEATVDYVFNPATPMPDNIRQEYQQPAPPQSPPMQNDFDDSIPL